MGPGKTQQQESERNSAMGWLADWNLFAAHIKRRNN